MTQEEKQLLLIDLCARLPYGVMVSVQGGEFDSYKYPYQLTAVSKFGFDSFCKVYHPIFIPFGAPKVEDFKPYLRPMSSMTEEEFEDLKSYSGLIYSQLDLASYQNGTYKCLDFYLSEIPSDVVILVFNWLNKNHFDYRGLIERGLAIEVTEENNPYKKSSLA